MTIRHTPGLVGDEQGPPEPPPSIRDLDPALAGRWSISDDVEHDEAIEAASTNDVELLVAAVDRSVLAAIDEYLDRANDHEDVVWLNDIARAALEADMELERRQGG